VSASDSQLARFRQAGLRAARWYVNSQCVMRKPYWDANHGRFIYNRYLPDGRTVLGLNWTQGRGIFVLLAAWELTGDETLLRSAVLAGEYIKILQIYDCPDNPRRQYAIREQVPQSAAAAPRDATEGCLGLLFLHRVTGEQDYLRRAMDYAQWFQTNAWDESGWPMDWVSLVSEDRRAGPSTFQAADGQLFYYLHKATGERAYLEHLVRLADLTLERFIRDDGAIVTSKFDPHHTGAGGEVLNDDGLTAALLCAHQATGDEKYLDACRRNARWIMTSFAEPPRMLCALPCMCSFLIELGAVTGDGAYRDWAASMLAKHVLGLQVRNRRDPMSDGAFRGEDEPVAAYGPKRAKRTDFITTRVTCYAALACLKLAGVVGPYYGALGWDRQVRRPARLPDVTLS